MKACFILQRRFAYSGHAMAKTLKKKYGVDQFCGYVFTRSSYNFLKSQTEIPYTELLLDEDVYNQYRSEPLNLDYIKELEKEYGLPNLWRYIEIDRVVRYGLLLREYPHNTPLHSHEEMMRILQVKAKNVINFLKKERPNFIVFAIIGDISTMLLYRVAKKMNIPTLFIQGARIENRFTVTNNYHGSNYIEEAFKQGAKNIYKLKAEEFLKSFRRKPMPPSFIDSPKAKPVTRKLQFQFLSPKKFMRSLSWAIQISWHHLINKHKDDYSEIKPWHYIIDRLKRKVRVLRGFNDLYNQIDHQEDYAFFPLQLEPEISSLLYAPFYTDQLWLAKQIARSLPMHFKLYIKEHPAMFGYRTREFYQELKKVPNVKLLNPSLLSFNITKNAKIILTTVGSAGWEGLLYKKPVITFGDVFYNILPSVKKCHAIEDLPQIIKEQIEHFKYDENTLINLIAAVYQESSEVNLTRIWDIEGGSNMDKKEQELIPLVDLISSKLGIRAIKV